MIGKSFSEIFISNTENIKKCIITYLIEPQNKIQLYQYNMEIYNRYRKLYLPKWYDKNLQMDNYKMTKIIFVTNDNKKIITFNRELDCIDNPSQFPFLKTGMFVEIHELFNDIGIVVNNKIICRKYGFLFLTESIPYIKRVWDESVGYFDNCTPDSSYLIWSDKND